MSITLDYLLEELRFKIGDIDPTRYRYSDEWLMVALKVAVKLSYRYLNNKYLIDSEGNVSRNPDKLTLFSTEDIIEKKDEPVLVCLAAITTLEGSLENSAWNTQIWRDNEISYSNVEGGKMKTEVLKQLQNELNDLVLPPTKRLGTAKKNSLLGYKNNRLESEGDF